MTKVLEDFEMGDLIVRQAVLDDCEELVNILKSWEEQEAVTGHADTDVSYFIKAINEGNVPPNGVKENFSVMTIKWKDNNQMVGFFEVYHGFPNDDTLWIGLFVMDKCFRSNGLGKKVMKEISYRAKNNGWSKLGIGVYLKNWRALRFWASIGFDRVRSVRGENEQSVDAFALMGLEKSLIYEGDSKKAFCHKL